MIRSRAGALLAGLAAGVLALAGCGEAADAGPGDGAPPAGETVLAGELVVFAAASLTESFTELGNDFESVHPEVSVTFNFAGSSALAAQINEGAPADVFASAAPANMQTVVDEDNAAGTPAVFARNQLVIAVAPGNPMGISELADLADPELLVALCAEQVPCGAAAETALDAGGVALTPVTLEQDVKAALSKVTLGEVDAALVYRTDAAAADADVDAVEFPESEAAINDYPIVVLAEAPNPDAAAAFVAYVQAEAGTLVLTEYGFQTG